MSVLSALLQVKTDTESVGHVRKMKAGCVSLGHLLSPTYQKEKISDCQGFSTPHNVHPAASGKDSPIPHICPVSQGPPCALTVCLCLWRFSFHWINMNIPWYLCPFRSFPSFHESFSWGGLPLVLCVCQDTFLSLTEGGLFSFSSFLISFLSETEPYVVAQIGLKLTK